MQVGYRYQAWYRSLSVQINREPKKFLAVLRVLGSRLRYEHGIRKEVTPFLCAPNHSFFPFWCVHLHLQQVAAFVRTWSLLVGVYPGAALSALLPMDLLPCNVASVKRSAQVPIMPMSVSQSRLQHLRYCSTGLSWI